MASEDGFSYLLPVQTEKHRRAPNWTDGEMKALLYVWEEYHNELKTSKRNAKVYEKMSQRFFQLTGEQRFKEEIKMKITNMSFQFRRLKATAGECGEVSDWPYFKPIEKILSRPLENGRVASVDFQTSIPGPSSDNMAGSKSDEGMVGFMPEYTGSSDELEIKQELDSLTSDSEFSSSRPVSAKKRPGNKHLVMKKKKLQMMQAMLVQQKRSSRAIEETCREVRRALHQQNLLQIQCLQLQERMMNLLEKMVLPSPAGPMHMVQSGIKNKKPPEGL